MTDSNTTELRPPPEHEGKALHWLMSPIDLPRVASWHVPGDRLGNERFFSRFWALIGVGEAKTPKEVAELGYRYLGPAEWHPLPIATAIMDFNQAIEDKNAIAAAYQVRIAELEAELHLLKHPTTSPAHEADSFPPNALKHSR